jgi:hypothetical protein
MNRKLIVSLMVEHPEIVSKFDQVVALGLMPPGDESREEWGKAYNEAEPKIRQWWDRDLPALHRLVAAMKAAQ